MKRVVIVGGGYAGTQLARALDAVADVALIEPKEAFVHNVAAIRAVVDPAWIDRLILPYDRLLKRGRVVRDRVSAIEAGGVRLEANGALEGDIVVVATGSTYARPFKAAGDGIAAFRAGLHDAHAALKAAKRIAIVGAGAVGVELAGEIAAGMTGKTIELVSRTATLFPDYTPGLGRRLQRDLAAMGVHVHLGATAEGIGGIKAPTTGPLVLAGALEIPADLVFPAIGAKPDAGLFAGRDGATFDRLGRVAVDGWLRPAGAKNLFALGDMAASGDFMTIVAITRQAPWLANTLKAVIEGRALESLPRYAPWPAPPILLPLGSRRGASVLPIGRSGLAVGALVTSALKGKALFEPRYRKEFGLA